jgi:hypothetical protein
MVTEKGSRSNYLCSIAPRDEVDFYSLIKLIGQKINVTWISLHSESHAAGVNLTTGRSPQHHKRFDDNNDDITGPSVAESYCMYMNGLL